MGHPSLEMSLFPKLFKDLMSIQSLLLWSRERVQKGPADAEAALQHIPSSLDRGAEQTLLPPKSFLPFSFPSLHPDLAASRDL